MAYQQPSPLNEGQNHGDRYPNHSPSTESPPSFHNWDMLEAVSIQLRPMIEVHHDQDSPPEPLSLTNSTSSIDDQLHSRFATLCISNRLPSYFTLVPKRLIAAEIQAASQYSPTPISPVTPPLTNSAKLHHRASLLRNRQATMKIIGRTAQRMDELTRIRERHHAKANIRYQKMSRELQKDMTMKMGAKRARCSRTRKAMYWVPVEASHRFRLRG